MRVGIANDTICFGDFPNQVSDLAALRLQILSHLFAQEVIEGSGDKEIQFFHWSNYLIEPKLLLRLRFVQIHELNILPQNIQVISMINMGFLKHSYYHNTRGTILYQIQVLSKERDCNSLMNLILSIISSVTMEESEIRIHQLLMLFWKDFPDLFNNGRMECNTQNFFLFRYYCWRDINYQRENPNFFYDFASHQAARRKKDGSQFRQIDYLMINGEIE